MVAAVVAVAIAANKATGFAVVGPSRYALAGPPRIERVIVNAPLRRVAPPRDGYVLVFPQRRGIPEQPGRWYPHERVLCRGWLTGSDAGCARMPRLAAWLRVGRPSNLFVRPPVHLTALVRGGVPLYPYGKRAAAILLALAQRGLPAAPVDCVPFTATWSAPGRPEHLCVGRAGGLYAAGREYPLAYETGVWLTHH